MPGQRKLDMTNFETSYQLASRITGKCCCETPPYPYPYPPSVTVLRLLENAVAKLSPLSPPPNTSAKTNLFPYEKLFLEKSPHTLRGEGTNTVLHKQKTQSACC